MRPTLRAALVIAALAALAVGAVAGEARTWKRISAPGQSNTSQVSLLRMPDGSLTALGLFKGAAPGGNDISKVTIAANGAVGAATPVATGAEFTILENPQAIMQGGVPLAVFGGLSTAGQDGLWTAALDSGARTFYGGSGGGPTAAASGTSAAASPSGGFAAWSSTYGLAAMPIGGAAAVPQSLPLTGCCAYNQAIAVLGGGGVWVGYDSNEDTAAGRWFQPIDPTTGAPVGARRKVPKSYVNGGFSFPVESRVPIAVVGNSAYTAWAQGYPTTDRVALWNIGGGQVKRYRPGMTVTAVGIAATPAKKLWLFWADASTGTIYAMRSNAARTEWEDTPIEVGKPNRTIETIYKMVGDASRADGKLDLVVSAATYVGSPTWYATQVAP